MTQNGKTISQKLSLTKKKHYCRHNKRALNNNMRRCVRNYCIIRCLKMAMKDDSVYFQVNWRTATTTCKENGNKTSFSKLLVSIRTQRCHGIGALKLEQHTKKLIHLSNNDNRSIL